MVLIALNCPRCAVALDAVDERQVFVCTQCGGTVAVAPGSDALAEVPRRLVRPTRRPSVTEPVVLVPMWSVSVRTAELGSTGDALPARVFVPAVGVARLPLLLQFARNLSRAPIDPRPWSEMEDVGVEPAEVSAEDAFVMAETVVLRHLEHWPSDDQLSDLEIPLGSASLLDWPCALRGSEVVDLVGGLSTHRSLVDAVGLHDRRAALQAGFERLGAPGVASSGPTGGTVPGGDV